MLKKKTIGYLMLVSFLALIFGSMMYQKGLYAACFELLHFLTLLGLFVWLVVSIIFITDKNNLL